ncbi:MAG: NADP-dependent malic enzyme [Nitrospinae bacterium]|nr:NADP-dependent malic enzyme [Nitrospinota bacterium]
MSIIGEEVLNYRKKYRGLIGIKSKIPIKDESILSLVYTPGVAEPCKEIYKDPRRSFDYTCRGNTVAIVTDGSAVLGLGNLGPKAALPVIECKSVIFKTFSGVDAFPICLDTQDTDEIIKTVNLLAPTFGAICMEDISAPKCFTIQHHLRESMNVCVFHNDQHAAAIEVLAGLINAAKVVEKDIHDMKIAISGAGAAGITVANMLINVGVRDIILSDTHGIIYKYRMEGMNWAKLAIARKTNREDKKGGLSDAIIGADAFIGLSTGDIISAEMISTMASDPIVFALSVPEPEIMPDEAKRGGAKVIATGRSDFPNEINTALVFPGFFRGILDVAARNINFTIMRAASNALAGLVKDNELHPDFIIPRVFDFQSPIAIAEAVAQAAIETGEARKRVEHGEIRKRMEGFIYEGHFPLLPEDEDKVKDDSLNKRSLELHRRHRGVIEINSKIPIRDSNILSSLYLPPCAAIPSEEIAKDPMKVYDYTCKNNLVAIVTDGSAVLGLGNIGPRAALPVMEGKAILFYTMAGVEAFPICVSASDPDEISDIVINISPTFGGVNLEDISAPRCFSIEERLKRETDIPIFHDDQHGTAVVVLAGLINALKLIGKDMADIRVVINGAGAAGTAVTNILNFSGIKDIVICDSVGIIYKGRDKGMNWMKEELAEITNPENIKGGLEEAIKGRDVFIGLSIAGLLNREMVRSMSKDPIVFALANPVPEIMPEEAIAGGARIVATGRSDFPNQVNNSLAFPGIFRGALDVRAKGVNREMKIAAAHAIAESIPENKLRPDYIIPKGLDFHVPPRVAASVAKTAMDTGQARIEVDPEMVARHTENFIYEGDLNLI